MRSWMYGRAVKLAVQDNGQPLADVVFGQVGEFLGADAVELKVNDRLVGNGIAVGSRRV